MQSEILRIIVTAVLAALLAQQAARTGRGTRRRLAFAAGALAFALFTIANLLPFLGVSVPWVTLTFTSLGLGLVLVSVLALLAAYRGGEMVPQVREARELLEAERRRREQRDEKEHPGSKDSGA
jgi:CHASE2 domain-containing sensor protein